MKTLKLLLQSLLEWVILITIILVTAWIIIQIKFYSQGMGTTPNHINHIPKPILHHHLLAEVVYRIRLLPNLQIQITHETKKIN